MGPDIFLYLILHYRNLFINLTGTTLVSGSSWKLTFWSAEMYSLRHGAHAFWVSGLDLKVVGGVQCQLLDLVSETVAHHRFNNPVVDLSVYICTVVDNIAYNRESQEERNDS